MKTRKELEAAYKAASDKCADLSAQMQTMLFDDAIDQEKYDKVANDFENMKFKRDSLRKMLAERDEDDDPDKDPANSNPDEDKDPEEDDPDDPDKEKEKGKHDMINLTKHSRGKARKIAQAKAKINAFIRHQPFVDETGVTTTVVEPTVPEEIIYNPESEVNSVVDLSTLVTRTPVTSASGTYPILKRATDYFPTVEELQENPKLANPEFMNIDWKVKSHRGAIAISHEAIADSQVDLTALIGQNIQEKKVNTYNRDISALLKDFDSQDTTKGALVDFLKHTLNVDLDPAYSPVLIASQSLYNALDTLKDNQGQYIFHQDINSGSGATILGIPVYKIGDDLLGAKGEANAFLGDTARAVLFADRENVTLSWEYDKVFGQYLAAALRYDMVKADTNAGFFVKCSDVAPAPASQSKAAK